jgi:hypothetical protein
MTSRQLTSAYLTFSQAVFESFGFLRDQIGVQHRRHRCGECAACLRQDCGSCVHCLDMKKFGGRGIKKQACAHRKCEKIHSEAGEMPEVEMEEDAKKISSQKHNEVDTDLEEDSDASDNETVHSSITRKKNKAEAKLKAEQELRQSWFMNPSTIGKETEFEWIGKGKVSSITFLEY